MLVTTSNGLQSLSVDLDLVGANGEDRLSGIWELADPVQGREGAVSHLASVHSDHIDVVWRHETSLQVTRLFTV